MAQKTVVLGVTGCIAAYKSCELVRSLQKRGFRVKVVMTEHATEFVTPQTFRALTQEPVAIGLFDDPSDPIHHISLAQEADVFVVAPATANLIAKMAHGIADDLLSTALLATTAPVIVAPAMNVHMYEHPATQANLALLRKRHITLVDPGSGYLACGDEGKGRLAEIDDIVSAICAAAGGAADMAGLKLLITAGPTVEPIDPVRYLSNFSSGKTGYAFAAAAVRRGAEVTLVSGPVSLPEPQGVRVIKVQTACEMHDAVSALFDEVDLAIFTAAVADLRPANPASAKLKKGVDDDRLASIELTANPDILASMGRRKTHQYLIGFAAETDEVERNGHKKLTDKRADMIVANEVGGGKAFGTDGNEVSLITAEGLEHLPYLPKSELADLVLDRALSHRAELIASSVDGGAPDRS